MKILRATRAEDHAGAISIVIHRDRGVMTASQMLTDGQWAQFGKNFIERYLAYGFGSMPKSEIDTLVFHLISESEAIKNRSSESPPAEPEALFM